MALATDRYVVARPLSRTILKWVLLPAMIVGFSLAWLLLWNATNVDSLTRWLFIIGFGLAILIMVLGEIYEIRRGGGPALEADATGIRISGMPRLSWSEVAEVRAEEFIGFGGEEAGHDEDSSGLQVGDLTIGSGRRHANSVREALDLGQGTLYHRLGIVPADPALAAKGEMKGRLGRIQGKMREVSLSRYGIEPFEFAPFGVMEYELRAPFSEVVARVTAFHPVTKISDLDQAPRP